MKGKKKQNEHGRLGMYTGTLIDELMTAVERTAENSSEREREERLAYWYAVSEAELAQFESTLAGVA